MESLKQAVSKRDYSGAFKQGTGVFYSIFNSLYWLGTIVEAGNSVQRTRLSWLTDTRLDVTKIGNSSLKSIARIVFTDQLLSIAKFAGVAGAALEVVLAAWQGFERLSVNDNDAAAGYFMSSAGFLVFMFSHLAGTSAVPLLGVTFAFALGALALVVALGALVWAIVCTDDALETWIKNGPFGKAEAADQFAHLTDSPGEAFEFLVGALFPMAGENRPLSYFEDNHSLTQDERDWLRSQNKTDAQVISVSSAAFMLMDKPEEQFKAHFWKHQYISSLKHSAVQPDYTYYNPDTYTLRFYFPKLEFGYVGRDYVREELKAKIQLTTSNGTVLPVSDMDEALQSAVAEPAFAGASPRWFTV